MKYIIKMLKTSKPTDYCMEHKKGICDKCNVQSTCGLLNAKLVVKVTGNNGYYYSKGNKDAFFEPELYAIKGGKK